jgi:transposase InsO family protein
LTSKKLGRFNRVGHRIAGDRTGQSNSRGVGWEFVPVALADASRIALAYYKSLGITVQRVMTDNGSCYKAKAFAKACRNLKLKHIRTKPYTSRTNGQAERFIQTALRDWANARAQNLLRLHN